MAGEERKIVVVYEHPVVKECDMQVGEVGLQQRRTRRVEVEGKVNQPPKCGTCGIGYVRVSQ